MRYLIICAFSLLNSSNLKQGYTRLFVLYYCYRAQFHADLFVFVLINQALDGFFIAIMTDGNILYVSESVTSLLEHLPVSNKGPFFSLAYISHPQYCRTNLDCVCS